MADACKAKTPAQNMKKTHEGSGKRRRKNKKPADSSGDGAPSTKSVQSNPALASTSQPQTKSDGASGGINACQGSSLSEKKTTKQEMNAATVNESAEKLLANAIDKEIKTIDVPGKHIPSTDIRDRKHDKQSLKEDEELSEKIIKQESNDRTVEKSSPQLTVMDKKDNELSATGIQLGDEKKDVVAAVTGEQQKGNNHNKTEQHPQIKPKYEKTPAPVDPQRKETAKAKVENKTSSELGQQAKGVPEKAKVENKTSSELGQQAKGVPEKAKVENKTSSELGQQAKGVPGKAKVENKTSSELGQQAKGVPEKAKVENKTSSELGQQAKGLPEKAKVENKTSSELGQQAKGVPEKAKVENKTSSELGQQAKGVPEKKPDVGSGELKSKAQLKAERRAVQEAQRAAKDARKTDTGGDSFVGQTNSSSAASVKHVGDKSKPSTDLAAGEKNKKKSVGELTSSEKIKKSTGGLTGVDRNRKKPVENVAQQVLTEEQMWTKKENEILGKSLKIDNNIMSLGFQYFHHNIVGANARCLALLATLKEVIAKYRTPDEKELSRDLEKNFLNPCISYINYCRPISTSMGNAIRHLKYHINKIPSDMEDETAISKLIEEIDNFIEVNIIKASEGVAHHAFNKIDDGDVILVYAASSLIGQVLKKAFKDGKKFRVFVVEGRPRSEGKSMLRYLVRCGIPCSYIYIGSASHAMSETTKVFLGAAAMFAIGDMYSRSGNSMIAALAKANNIPVLVCCETYKFTDKVQLHSADSNLHTRVKDLVSIGHKTPILADWEEIGLGLLNLMYDVTGSQYITAVVTELGMLPCTSVPVVLRRQEDLY